MRPLALLALFVTLGIWGCKKEEDDPDPTPAPTEYGEVRMAFSFRKNGGPFGLGSSPYSILHDGDGRMVRIDGIKFLLSNIRLRDGSGNVKASFPDVVILGDASAAGTTSYLVGSAPVGTYADLVFNIGLATADSSSQPSDHGSPPLSDATLYTDAAHGYKYVEVTGRTDADNNLILNGSDPAVSLKCTGSTMIRQEVADWNGSDVNNMGMPTIVNVILEVADLLNGIPTAASPTTIGGGPVNAQLVNNLQIAIP